MLRNPAENMTIKGEAEVITEWWFNVLAGFESTNEVKYQTCVHAMEVKNGIRARGIERGKK